MKRPRLSRVLLVLVGLLLAIQLLPFGRNHVNPPVVSEPKWDSPETRALFFRACADCHSNETKWPWYSNVAPVSWLVARDVHGGRRHLDVSEWNRPQKNAKKAAGELRDGEMPLAIYLPLHAAARLSADEKAALVRGLAATLGDEKDGKAGGKAEGEDEDDDDD